jgi:hypothetical protein
LKRDDTWVLPRAAINLGNSERIQSEKTLIYLDINGERRTYNSWLPALFDLFLF